MWLTQGCHVSHLVSCRLATSDSPLTVMWLPMQIVDNR